MPEIVWCVLVNFIIRWGYCSGDKGMWRAKYVHFESWFYCFILACKVSMEPRVDTCYLCRRSATFRIVPGLTCLCHNKIVSDRCDMSHSVSTVMPYLNYMAFSWLLCCKFLSPVIKFRLL
jgi:hypothetical protein